MSSLMWKVIYSTIRLADKSVPRARYKTTYSDTLIVAMYFWSVINDRPLCWAADRSHYASAFRPRRWPSRSQFCRRVQSARCQAILQTVHERLARSHETTPVTYLDARALPVGPHTTDVDAPSGWTSGGFAHGYKVHALVTEDGRFTHFSVQPLNVSEKRVAAELIAAAAPAGWVLADGGYDSGELYDAVHRHGGQLLTPLPENAGGGHRPASAARLFAAELWALGIEPFYQKRRQVERHLGQLSSYGGGLAPLPAWVRRLQRVRRWVTAKIIIYHARLTLRTAAA
jgi:hypothetical protein